MAVAEAVLVWKGFDFLNVSYDGSQVEELLMRQVLDLLPQRRRFGSTLRRLKAERTQKDITVLLDELEKTHNSFLVSQGAWSLKVEREHLRSVVTKLTPFVRTDGSLNVAMGD
jgi:hypothetical protein